jgi:hypothetical protein
MHSLIPPGSLRLLKSLDYEKSRQYILTVQAKDKGEPPLSSSTVVKVNVTDHNDNAPWFARSEYHVSVKEDQPIGTQIVSVSITLSMDGV